ncbi:MAG: DegT/DnrJ/EryC1/StrS family aminotransferase [Planctomycetota bacterium]|jgi:dTDP-4-amino-4,6-dideoxygalactose transaminase
MTRRYIQLAKPSFDEREVNAIRRVLDNRWVVQGPEVEAFEKTIAQMHHASHCIAVSSGTAALHICYLVLGIGPGDVVFIPSFAWPSAANMAMMVGARPEFVDVLPGTYNIDPTDLQVRMRKCVENNWGIPRVIVPVHQFGLAADMNTILRIAREFEIEIIEDAACALGSTYKGQAVGTFGKMGIFSFHPRKAVTTGEGGAIVTNDESLAEKCRMYRNHGQLFRNGRRCFPAAGLNYRMTEIQAAIGRVQLNKFPEILKRRREIASHYLNKLGKFLGITLPMDDPEHTWQTFMIELEKDLDRSEIIDRLAQQGIGAGAGSVSAHCLEVYQEKFGYKNSDLPISQRLNFRGLALPLYSDMTHQDVNHCITEICKISKLNNCLHQK